MRAHSDNNLECYDIFCVFCEADRAIHFILLVRRCPIISLGTICLVSAEHQNV